MRLRSNSNPPNATIRQLVKLVNQGKLQTVSELAKKLTFEFPNSFILWNILGIANKGLGRMDAAVEGFSKACCLNPEFPDAHNNLGVTLNALEKHEEAIACFTRASRLKPDYVEAHNNLGATLLKLGKHDKAAASFVQAARFGPDNADARNNLGFAYQAQGKLEKAIASFERALELGPDNAGVLNNLGFVFHKQGEFENAVASFERALEIKPDFAEAFLNLGMVFSEQAKHDAAIASYKRALMIKPDYAGALNNLGKEHVSQGEINEALHSFMRAIEIAPDDVKAYLNCARLPTGALPKDLLEKIESIDVTSKDEPDGADFKFFQANILRHRGKADESFKFLKSANRAAENKAENHLWQKQIKSTTDEIAQWTPTQNVKGPTKSYKVLYILGPSRSGKSTIEEMLDNKKGFRRCFEGWRGNVGIQHLKGLKANNSAQSQAEIEKILYVSEKEISESGNRVLTCTNPGIVSVAHLIHDTFDNAFFLFVQRNPLETASDIFAKEYASGNFYSYNAKSALDYVEWYYGLADILQKKMPQRAACIRFEEIIEDHKHLTNTVESLLGEKLSPKRSSSHVVTRNSSSEYLDNFKNHLKII